MKRIYLLLGASYLSLTQGVAASAQELQSASAAGEQIENSANDGDIIVTATRRSETIREVPIAVSAFGGDQLRDAQIASLVDISAIAPNVQISTFLTNANVTIRGVGNGNFIQIGGDPGVAIHQNGIYLGQSALALMTFLDVERVEILRGPQGTLFGRNATGGAANIISKAPTASLSYGFDLSLGVDPGMVRSSAYLSGALDKSGKLLARLSVGQNYNTGFSKNLEPTGPQRLDGVDDFAARAQLEFLPTERFSVRFLAEYQQNKDAGPAAYLSGVPVGAAGTSGPAVFPFVLLPLFGLPPVPDLVPPASSIGQPGSRRAQANAGRRDMEARTFAAIAEWDIGGGNLKGLISYNESNNTIAQDGDGTAIPFTATYFTNRADQSFAEILYSSDSDKAFSFVLGSNYFDEHITQDNIIPTLNYAPLINYFAGGAVDTTSYSVFGRAQYEVSPTLRLFGGARYSHDKKEIDEYLTFGLANTNADEDSWSKVTYELGASADLGEFVTAYAKYATGYKSGGYSVSSFNPSYDPETNSNIEAGVKGLFLDGALQANLAVFHMRYRNLQVNQVQGLASSVTNAAEASVTGVELETVLRPTEGLRIEASGGWLDAKFDSFDTGDSSRPGLGILDLTGNRLPGAPEFAGRVAVYQDIPTSFGTFTLGGSADWKSRIHFSEFNIPISSQSNVGRLDLFLNYRSRDERWSASLFARNVTNEQIKSNVTVVSALLGSLAVAQYQPSRQIGFAVGYRF